LSEKVVRAPDGDFCGGIGSKIGRRVFAAGVGFEVIAQADGQLTG
jgi:hypothetical protein